MSIGINSSGNDYISQIASGSRLNRAADNPADTGIVEKLEAQTRGYDVGQRNAEDGRSVLNVADGALSSVTDRLQQMRELAVQASNTAVLSKGDRSAIQKQIEQLKQGISDVANSTEFNTKKLLDGSNDAMHIATGADGSGMEIDTGNATLQALGIEDFDVTKDFDISTIDNALAKVNEARGSIGAQSNSLDYTIGYNTQTSYNLTKAQSGMEDTDIAKAISEQKKQELLQTVQFMMQKKEEEEMHRKASLLV